MDDPAAVIAHALRKKFSHRIFQDSPGLRNRCVFIVILLNFVDKENLDNSFADSPGPSMRLVCDKKLLLFIIIISFFHSLV